MTFQLDDNNHIWVHIKDESGEHSLNLGPRDDFEEAVSQFLGEIEERS